MAIFSRRIIQNLIDENAAVLNRGHLKKQVADLNRMHLELILAPEWETLLINALSKIGYLQYEKKFSGTKTPDIYFKSSRESTTAVVADITAISDQGFDRKFPNDQLEDRVIEKAVARGFRMNAFSFEYGSNISEARKGRFYLERDGDIKNMIYGGAVKSHLKLPAASRLDQKIFNIRFEAFLDEIGHEPSANRDYHVYEPDENIDVLIQYRPQNMFSSVHGLDHKRINHLTENNVYQALQSKADQLVAADCREPLGIFLCDGGYTPFHGRGDWSTHRVSEVIEQFLKDVREIAFVITLVVEQDSNRSKSPKRILTSLYKGQSFSDLDVEIIELLTNKMPVLFPEPERDATNAMNRLKGRYPQEGSIKGLEESYQNDEYKIKISARRLLELLAGRMSHEDFSKLMGWVEWEGKPKTRNNPFADLLDSGKMISELSFESLNPADDDCITVKFKGPDPAVSPFVVPQQKMRLA